MKDLPALATAKQFADYSQLSLPTLARMRAASTGPRVIRMGRSVRYRREDILAWLEDLQREGA